jgi:hypothetical protein
METRLNKLLNVGAAPDIDGLKVIRPLWQQYLGRAKATPTKASGTTS